MRPKSLAVRLVLGAGLWIAAALAVGGYLLSALFAGSVERGFDSRLNVMVEAFVAVSEVGPGNTLRLTQTPPSSRFQQPFSGWYWQIADANGPVLRSRSLWDQVLPAGDAGAAGGGEGTAPFEITGPGRRTIRVLQRTISLPGSDQSYVYTIAGDVAAMDADIAAFNAALSWSLAALGLVLVIAVFVQVRYGLRPLARIEAALGAIRSGSAHHLEGEFPSEINPLATEINALLEQNAAVLKRARTHVGNLAHALKTPLAVLGNEAAGAEGSLAETALRQAAVMQRHIDHHLSRARTAAARNVLGGRTEVMPAAESLGRTLKRIHAERRLDIAFDIGPGAAFGGERQDLEEMLGNLMDNACKWAKAEVRVGAAVKDGLLRLRVEDDGPGLAKEARDAVLKPGERLDESVPGAGLGLAIVRDIADLYGGAIALEDSDLGGLRVALTLPAANSPASGPPGAKGA
jgi:signal transduction histidine kinase